MKALLCLIMAVFMVNISAFAEEEVWVFDPDEGAVVVHDDGTTEPFTPEFSVLDAEPPLDEPAASLPDPEPVADPVPEDPVIQEPVEEPERYAAPDSYEELDDLDVDSFPSYAVMSLNEEDPSPLSDPEDRSMKDVVVMVLGEYSPKTQTVTQYLSDGSSDSYVEIVPGVAGMDWEWIGGAALFALVLFSFFKFVGVLLRNG